jgi:hypothetical protein
MNNPFATGHSVRGASCPRANASGSEITHPIAIANRMLIAVAFSERLGALARNHGQ